MTVAKPAHETTRGKIENDRVFNDVLSHTTPIVDLTARKLVHENIYVQACLHRERVL